MLSAFWLGSRLFRRTWNVLMVLAVLAVWGASSPARAQTAQFSYAIATLGGGFSTPHGVAVDASGNVFVADTINNAVKEIPSGCVSSSCVTTLGGGFSGPVGVAVDASGNVYVADTANNKVKEIPSGCASSSCVTTLGGGFNSPYGAAVDANGNVYVADTVNAAVKEIPSGCASSSCVVTLAVGFSFPNGVAVDASGNVYVADSGNNAVKEIPSGCASSTCVTTLGGGFHTPNGVAVDASGNVYVADANDNAVEEIPSGCATASCVTTLGGGFNTPYGVAVDASGNAYVADSGNNAVKKIELRSVDFSSEAVGTTSAAQTLTFTFSTGGMLGQPAALTLGAPNLDFAIATGGTCIGGTSFNAGDTCTVNATFTPKYAGARNGAVDLTDNSGAVIATAYVHGVGSGPQAAFDPGTTTTLAGGFNYSSGVAVDSTGNVFVADTGNNAVKEIPTGCASASCVTTLGGGFFYPSYPSGVAVDGTGNVYVADSGNNAVKEIPTGCASASCVTTLGGGFNYPSGMAVDSTGNVFVADDGNNAVKEIPTGCASASCVTTLGGGFNYPYGVTVDASGNVYVADTGNNAVKEIPPGCASASCVTTLGGGFNTPYGVTVDASGNIIVGDNSNNAVKEIPTGCTSASCVTTLGGGFSSPTGVAVDASGNVLVADTDNTAVKEIQRATPPALSFASTNVGATSSDSPQTVTVENIGNQPLTFPIPTVSGSYNPSVPANFSYSNSSTCLQNGASAATAFTLASGASCTVAIDFAPTTAGSISGDVVLTDDSLNAAAPNYTTQQIPLSGTGIQPITQLGFSTAPPATITAGGNSGTVTVAEQDSGGATVTTAADSITLTVTGPNSYSEIYTQTATSGVTTFDLSSVILKAAGSYTYTATSGSYTEATAAESVSAASADSIGMVSGSGQSAAIGTAFANTLVVKVEDSYGNPVLGATVVYTAPSSGASATLSTPTTTAADGETEVTATANGTAGATAYNVTASVSGVSGTGTFALINTKATATVTLGNLSQAYTGSPLSATATTNPAGLAVSLTYNGSTTAPTEADSYTVVATITDPDHTGTATGTLVIAKAMPLAAWPAPASIPSGIALSATQLDATATYNGAVVPGAFVYTPTAGTVLSAGDYMLSARFTPTDTTDFSTPAEASVPLTVVNSALTVTANNTTRVYGAANPTFTGSVTGAIHGDSFTESFSTTATQSSNVGSYTIVPNATGTNLANYTVKTTNGTLTITQAASATVLSASASSVNPGQSLTLTAEVTDASSGSTGTPTGTVTFFDGSTQLGTAALSGGAASYATSTLAPGAMHSLTASYNGDTNFLASTSTSPISVPVVNLTFSLNLTGGQEQTVAPGSAAIYTLQISPTYGVYPGDVSFSVSGLPQGATATFSPPTIAANGGPQTVTMTIQTPGTTTAQSRGGSLFKRGAPLALGFLLLPLFGVRKRKRWMRMFSLALLLIGAGAFTGMISGCGAHNGFNGQQQKSYSVTVTATGGTVSQTTVVILNVE